MPKVHVVCGGDSSEREVSLRSGSAVADALRDAGYEVAVLDTSAKDEELKNCDVVFPVLHGVGGEE
jgi:D-alanine-D-alanine ligase